jgi:DNA-directed RNA polymerase subunit RPC12/RpoP
MAKMRRCSACGNEISAKGKVTCPYCGQVNKKPFYKRVWFIILALFVVLSAFGSLGDEDTPSSTSKEVSSSSNTEKEAVQTETEQSQKEPVIVSVDELLYALDTNALKAAKTYEDQYVQLTGELSVIDAQGDYFSLVPIPSCWTLDSVRCKIGEEHLDAVMEFTENQEVTVTGTITDIGEVLGYTLKVESIIDDL